LKTKREIIEETYEYYKTHPKAISGKGCAYLTSDGNMCAVGRCMNDETIKFQWENMNLTACKAPYRGFDFRYGICIDSNAQVLDSLLKEEYRGHEYDFWEKLQHFHDAGLDKSGINMFGEECYKLLLKEYGNE